MPISSVQSESTRKPAWRRWLAGLFLPLLVVTGCGQGAPYKDLNENAQLVRSLRQIQNDTGRIPLRDLTGGDWDEVFVHSNAVGDDQESIEEDVGDRVDLPRNPASDVWMTFVRNGDALHAVGLPLTTRPGRYGPDVLVVNTHPNSSTVDLVEPRIGGPAANLPDW